MGLLANVSFPLISHTQSLTLSLFLSLAQVAYFPSVAFCRYLSTKSSTVLPSLLIVFILLLTLNTLGKFGQNLRPRRSFIKRQTDRQRNRHSDRRTERGRGRKKIVEKVRVVAFSKKLQNHFAPNCWQTQTQTHDDTLTG